MPPWLRPVCGTTVTVTKRVAGPASYDGKRWLADCSRYFHRTDR